MKFQEIFRFELAYQLRRPWPWLSFAVLIVFAFFGTRSMVVPATLAQDFLINSPFIITTVSVFSSQIWLLLAPAVAGEAAARDVHSGMYPLLYASPTSKLEYLGGRFLAALALNAFILLGVQIGSLLAVYAPGINPEIVGRFRPAAYLSAYVFIALTNAVIATTFQFAAALISKRPMASYVGSFALFFLSYPVTVILYFTGIIRPEMALLTDPIGVFAIMNEMMSNWTIVEKNVRMFRLEGGMLWNRLLWVGIALATLGVLYLRFRFAHYTANEWWTRLARRFGRQRIVDTIGARPVAIAVPHVQQSFTLATHLRQLFAIATSSFRMIATSPAGLFLLGVFPFFMVIILLGQSEQWNVPLMPRTGYIVSKHLTSPITQFADYRVIIPLLIIYFAGELIWRERDARMNENVDATSVPEWVLFLGKYLGLGFALAALMVGITVAGVIAQTIMGYHDYRLDLYAQFLFGLQLPEYLIFAVLIFLVHALVNHKYLGQLIAFVVYLYIAFAAYLGIEHNLFIYGAGPDWSFTDMRGFGATIMPWLWFKLYWVGWALLLALLARIVWVRGRESGLRARWQIARLRINRSTVSVAALALAIMLTFGGFVFYNTNVLNEFITNDEMVARRAEYERRYGKYEDAPQPQRAATRLNIEIYPDQRRATMRGTYTLVNRHSTPINQVHIEPAFYADTKLTWDRPTRTVVSDAKLGHFIYALAEPLQPGDSMTLEFDVELAPRGFRERGMRATGAGDAIVENGTNFSAGALPVIGYQPLRELWSAADRQKHGLPRQVTLPNPGDIDPRAAAGGAGRFEAVIGTRAGQVAVAPGELRRTWNQDDRSYFHYVSDVPLNGTEFFFSANYKVHRERWRHVDVQIFLHPGHTEHLDRLLRSVRATFEYNSDQFSEYPLRFMQIIEQPGNFLGMGVDGSGVITGGEGFFLLDPREDGVDAIFQVVAHEMGHLWWGMQLKPAFAEGGGVISEGLAWYSAMQAIRHANGDAQLRQFQRFMRQPHPWPPIRTGLPLLRAMDPWANYRKAPYAMFALSEYMGEARVNHALRTLIEKKRDSLATTLDLYRELQAVAPDTLQYLVSDLFERNTFWDFETKEATAQRTPAGTWQVTLKVHARKTVTDSAGAETVLPMNEMISVGVFAKSPNRRDELGAPLHLQMHRIRAGAQTITITVPREPYLAGIDPHHLLDWVEGEDDDNIEGVAIRK